MEPYESRDEYRCIECKEKLLIKINRSTYEIFLWMSCANDKCSRLGLVTSLCESDREEMKRLFNKHCKE